MDNTNSEKIYIGMDLHKKTSTFVVKERFGRVLAKHEVGAVYDFGCGLVL